MTACDAVKIGADNDSDAGSSCGRPAQAMVMSVCVHEHMATRASCDEHIRWARLGIMSCGRCWAGGCVACQLFVTGVQPLEKVTGP